MIITKLSDDLTPLHKGIFFGIETESDTPSDLLVEVVNIQSGAVVAEQQLHNVTSADVNIAPYITLSNDSLPQLVQNIHISDAPSRLYAIRIDDIESEPILISTNRKEIDALPAIITSLPLQRTICEGESDELMLAVGTSSLINVEICSNLGEEVSLEHNCEAGVATLYISTNDFAPETTSFDVVVWCDGAPTATLHYNVKPKRKGDLRLGWISDDGAVERYTFPTSSHSSLQVSKQTTMLSPEKLISRCTAKKRVSICSHYEPRSIVEVLSQIIASPKVWSEEDGHCRMVEVITSEVEYDLFGEPSCVALDIALWQKEVAL